MKIRRGDLPPTMLRELQVGEAFERVCNQPKAVYLVCYTTEGQLNLRALVDLTNNRVLPIGHFPADTEVLRLKACVEVAP